MFVCRKIALEAADSELCLRTDRSDRSDKFWAGKKFKNLVAVEVSPYSVSSVYCCMQCSVLRTALYSVLVLNCPTCFSLSQSTSKKIPLIFYSGIMLTVMRRNNERNDESYVALRGGDEAVAIQGEDEAGFAFQDRKSVV